MNGQVIREKNILKLEQRYPGISSIIESMQINNEDEVCVYETYDHQIGFYIQKEDGIIQLNSQYEAVNYADEWADYMIKKEEIKKGCVVVVYGFGNGNYIQSLLKKLKRDVRIVVYEPSVDVFLQALQYIDIAGMMEYAEDNLDIFVEQINMKWFRFYWLTRVKIQHANLISMISIPGYQRIFTEQLSVIYEMITSLNELIHFNWNTKVKFAEAVIKNQLALISYLSKVSDLSELLQKLPKNYPAIVVAAGPSLKKNIQELKRAKNKAFIIAVDTALKLLLTEDIIPDIYVTIDPDKPLELFEHEKTHHIPVCITTVSTRETFEKQQNNIFLSSGESYLSDLFVACNMSVAGLKTGGSVATTAFDLAVKAGMNPVVLIGQDLAFTGGKVHAEGTYTKHKNIQGVDENAITWIEDIYGEKVGTRKDWLQYKLWYEEQIEYHISFDIRVIDATEGGAKIKGTEIMTLREVIDKECTKEYDYEKLLQSIRPMLDEEHKTVLYNKIKDMPEEFRRIYKLSKEGKDKYERLLTLSRRKVTDVKEAKSLMKELDTITDKITKKLEYKLIELYISEVSKEALWNLEQEEDNVQADLRNVAERGLRMMSAIHESVSRIMQDVDAMLEKL